MPDGTSIESFLSCGRSGKRGVRLGQSSARDDASGGDDASPDAQERHLPDGAWRCSDGAHAPIIVGVPIGDHRGVAFPTGPQVRAWSLMSPEERATVHALSFDHVPDGPCPLEAALSAYEDDRAVRMIAGFYLLVVAVVVGVAVAFPHAKQYDPWTGGEDAVPAYIAGLAALSLVVSGLMTLPRLIRERRQNHSIALTGPTCNPWTGLEDDPRSRWSAVLSASVPNLLWLFGFHHYAERHRRA